MSKTEAQLVSLTQARYNAKHGVRVHSSDPRLVMGHIENWPGTYDWFPFRKFEGEVIVWVEVGYGHYALEVNGNIVGMGKDVLHGGGYTLIGECASQDGELHVSKDCLRIS